jgi:septal ring factor EnvC (AmiA/AmiB activator)
LTGAWDEATFCLHKHKEKEVVMDDAGTVTAKRVSFQTPPRILVPKLVESRKRWKAKADARKKLLKAASIRTRDLQVSRGAWKDRGQAAEQQVLELQTRLEQRERELADARAEIAQLHDAKKNRDRML